MNKRQLIVILALALSVLVCMAWTLFNISSGDLDTMVLAGTLTTLAIVLFIGRIKPLI